MLAPTQGGPEKYAWSSWVAFQEEGGELGGLVGRAEGQGRTPS